MQRSRQARVDTISNFLVQEGIPVPPDSQPQDSESIEEARLRIIWALGFINLSILVISGVGGYLLAGLTLDPISKMVKGQKEFIGNASHELRTPLTSLKTEIEVALRDKEMTVGEARELLKSNLEDVNGMQRLSNYLLNLNRYEKGEGINLTDVDLKSVVIETVENTANFAASKNIKIRTDVKDVRVKGNKDALIELTTILLDNAIKYSGKSKIVEIRVKSGGILEVQDHGMGISTEDLTHIFDRFYRSDKSRGTDGYGLGLSIAKSITDLHKGRIEVISKEGKGSTFRVHLQ
jgi:two-component system sensor histidine kinase CiaH